jgi:hypothetical protein
MVDVLEITRSALAKFARVQVSLDQRFRHPVRKIILLRIA